MKLFESSLDDLYKSAVDAFPNTKMRQHATHSVVIKNIHWVPYVGMKTLFIKGLAQNENREYSPLILFKNVNYDGDQITITTNTGREASFDKLSSENTDVVLRCGCGDFKWRFCHYNKLDKSLYGRDRTPYEATGARPPANPLEMPGMCKHLMQLSHVLNQAGIFTESNS